MSWLVRAFFVPGLVFSLLFASGCEPLQSEAVFDGSHPTATQGEAVGASADAQAIALSLAPSEVIATINPITAEHVGCGAPVENYYLQACKGSVRQTVNFPAAETYRFDITAKGSLAGGNWPVMALRIDGKEVGRATVKTESFQVFSFSAAVAAGSHRVAVAFLNDFESATEDRNLFLSNILIFRDGVTPTPTPTQTPTPTSTTGWTNFTPSADSRVIYVSSSTGNDSNSGLSSATPVRTLARAVGLARAGMPDHILLKRGDSWTENLSLRGGGRSKLEPMVISSYGTGARPILRRKTGVDHAVEGGTSYTAIMDLQLIGPYNNEDTAGISFFKGGRSILIENNYIAGWRLGLILYGYEARYVDVTVRRNVIVENANDHQPAVSNSNGAYFDSVDNLILEENIFDHNGWRDGKNTWNQGHNVYIQGASSGDTPANACTNPTVRNNITLRGMLTGLSVRAEDGNVTGNLAAGNSVGIFFYGRSGSFKDNVIVEGIIRRPLDGGDPNPAWGVVGPLTGVQATNNIVANVQTIGIANEDWWRLAYDVSGSPALWSGNVSWNWPNKPEDGGKAANRTSGFQDPSRSFSRYAEAMGYSDIYGSLRKMERGNWDDRLTAPSINAWIRAGFGM